MKIIDKREESFETKFKNIQPGATFFWGSWYFLKLSSAGVETGSANAVCLADGLPEDFGENDFVIPVKATLTIS